MINEFEVKMTPESNWELKFINIFRGISISNNLRRLSDGVYSANVGAQYQELASDSERIADHLINVGKSIRTLKQP